MHCPDLEADIVSATASARAPDESVSAGDGTDLAPPGPTVRADPNAPANLAQRRDEGVAGLASVGGVRDAHCRSTG